MNKRLKISLILIAIILIAALAISLAYSKYFSQISGTGTATVAKWYFTVNGQSTNLGTITLGNTTASNNKVADGKVAPGTSGSFDIALDATGTEVALDYTITFDNLSGTMPTNLKFYEDSAYTSEITNITSAGLTGSIGLSDTKTKTVTIYWKWDYETGANTTAIAANDTADTTDGQAATTISFDVIVTGTQQQYV